MAIDLDQWELRHLEIDDPQKYNDLEGTTYEEKLETYKRLKEDYRIANNPVTKALQRLEETRQKQDINITIPIDIHLQAQSPGQVQGQAPESAQAQGQELITETINKLISNGLVIKKPAKQKIIKGKTIDIPREYWISRRANVNSVLEYFTTNPTPGITDVRQFMTNYLKGKNGGSIANSFKTDKSRKKQ